MSEKIPKDIEMDYQKIIEKISKEKEDRQKGLEELYRRKRKLDKFQEKVNHDSYSPRQKIKNNSKKLRQAISSERDEYNKKVYSHLLSPISEKILKSPKIKYRNRMEEDEAYHRMLENEEKKHKLKMLDRRARYAGIVKEIYTPTIDMQKRFEVEQRINKDNAKSYISSNPRSGSLNNDSKKVTQPYQLNSSNSLASLRKNNNGWGQR